MQFSREEEITAELNMDEEEIAKYDRLKKNYEDPTFEVVSGVFRALSRRKIIGVGAFQRCVTPRSLDAAHPAAAATDSRRSSATSRRSRAICSCWRSMCSS